MARGGQGLVWLSLEGPSLAWWEVVLGQPGLLVSELGVGQVLPALRNMLSQC